MIWLGSRSAVVGRRGPPELLRGPSPPRLKHVRYEADRFAGIEQEQQQVLASSQGNLLPIYVPLGEQAMGSSTNIVVRPRPAPRGENVQGGTAMMNTQGGMMGVQGGNAMMNTQDVKVMMNTQGANVMMNVQDGNAMMNTEGANAMMNTQGANAMEHTAMMNTQGANVMMTTQGSSTKYIPVITPLGATPKKTTILYYDPAVGPGVAYDANGTAMLLSSLQTDHTEIYMEQAAPLQQAMSTTEQEPPELSLDIPQGQTRDQMIIVSTVATMALLVGALSARRMRSRQFLSSCIENESLEDEVAYDTAYTSGYDTFGPWKGDLEKFDVYWGSV